MSDFAMGEKSMPTFYVPSINKDTLFASLLVAVLLPGVWGQATSISESVSLL